jgi:hypothetical protein
MMTEYSLSSIKVEIPSIIKARDSSKGKAYYNYQIVVTSPSPFKRWKVDRRFGQFMDLFAFFSGTRRIKTDFPRPSILQFSLSKGTLAKQRVKALEAFLKELLSHADLRVPEMDQLYSFLDVELMTDDAMERDSDFGDVRKELFPDMRSHDGRDGSEDEQSPAATAVARAAAAVGAADDRRSDADSDDVVKLASSFNSEFRPTDDLSTEPNLISSPARVLCSVASFRQESETKERQYNVTADGMKEALRNNDKNAVTELLKKSKSLATQVDDAGNPMIYTAALYGAIDLGIALIAAGADPQSVNRQGISAMDIAFDPWREAIQRFVDHRAETRFNAGVCRYETIVTVVKKGPTGSIGLNIVRTTDNSLPLVLGCTKPVSEGTEYGAAICIPAIKPNDIIIAVNGTAVADLNSAVTIIKASPHEVELTLSRRVAINS